MPFDIRGVIDRPAADILVQRPARRMHFLQGATSLWLGPTNERPVAVFVVHYADGRQHEFPIVFGEDVRDWDADTDPTETVSRGKIAWRGRNAADHDIRLFLSTWENPFPGQEVGSVDYVSAAPNCAPFLIAATVEP